MARPQARRQNLVAGVLDPVTGNHESLCATEPGTDRLAAPVHPPAAAGAGVGRQVTVSLILPTIARPSLRLMLASLVDAAPEVGAGGGRGRPLPAVRAMVDESGVAGTRCLHVFRVMPAAGFMVPQDEERRLRLGFVDIDGVVVPRSVARRCRFGAQYTGDYDFIVAGAGALAAQPAWHGDVISVNQGWADRRGVTRLE